MGSFKVEEKLDKFVNEDHKLLYVQIEPIFYKTVTTDKY